MIFDTMFMSLEGKHAVALKHKIQGQFLPLAINWVSNSHGRI